MKNIVKEVGAVLCAAFSFIYMLLYITYVSPTAVLPFMALYFSIPVFILLCVSFFIMGKRTTMFDARAYVWRHKNHLNTEMVKLRNFIVLSKKLANEDTEAIIEEFTKKLEDSEDADYR